jgi:hypothetical protein
VLPGSSEVAPLTNPADARALNELGQSTMCTFVARILIARVPTLCTFELKENIIQTVLADCIVATLTSVQ